MAKKILLHPSAGDKKAKPLLSKSKDEAAPPEKRGYAEDAIIDGLFAAAQGATFNLADEGYGAAKALLDDRPFEEAYPQHRDVARREWKEARERSPIATTVGEIGGAVVSPGSKILGAGKGLRGILRGGAEGAAQSYGATEKESLQDQLIETGMGAGIGAGTGAVMNLATKGFSKSPNATRSEVLGVKPKDYRVDGPADRKQIVERIKDTGMLKNRKMEYDADQMKFVPKNKSKFAIDELEKNTEERLLQRSQDAVEKLQQRKERYFGMQLDNRYVSAGQIDQMAVEIAEEYRKRGLMKGPFDRTAAVEKIKENIYDSMMVEGGDMSKFTLRQIDQLKRQAQEDVRNFSKALGELGDNDELARITARKLKHLVEDNIGHADFKKINSAQHDFLTIGSDIRGKIRSLELAPPQRIQAEKTNFAERFVDSTMGGSQGRLDNAARKEWWQKNIPNPVRAAIPYAAEETPGVLYRQQMQGNEVQVQFDDPGHPMNRRGRTPQSVPNLPEQLIRTPLPRKTTELMQKKPFVLAKVAQMMPDMFEAVQDAYEHNPESIGEIAQVLAVKMPHVFEKDKYNRFDGRILSEQDKQKAIKDTLLRKDIDSIAQADIITKLNQEGLFEG